MGSPCGVQALTIVSSSKFETCNSGCFFFPSRFLQQGLGFGLLYWAVGKSKPCFSRKGWGSAGGSELTWQGRCILVGSHPRCCRMMCTRFAKLAAREVKVAWARSADRSAMRSARTARCKRWKLWRALALASWRVNTSVSSLQWPPFNATNDQAAAPWMDKFWARPFLGPSHIPERRACILSSVLSGWCNIIPFDLQSARRTSSPTDTISWAAFTMCPS